ncbi:MAG: hypothetical protein A2504_16865 [Bdellovibrionales bacterium RIFOXYD12_FULL_39_22]|nr:MAG: hypothetical protein A2385_12800 [Bdellovibrionales bacterium RIFOXYB1_FULL_39_21]OFZ42470.1 MAG: hypothetical protein A2485_04115 [Bdellovibrionales bacterium RIFOXYC12_FULL_39_17]OFZ45780.1 MAG: hypothetical protein A2404_17560 [Bdellovibrionales bacterium RIFOXYC1_FULL_39_130]OFZ74677.1 MAG: hypothetical protein A2560_08370 [Bdellovibrionales bacterium RIFOXYD1_FULL_39_84]OFZ94363.1 MAG: hypothetical protein A2504_16865 [Bdellovibrionales bacterium RIFOXYD12_FULL_39_22]
MFDISEEARNNMSKRLMKMFRKLSKNAQRALHLRYWELMTIEEISHDIGMSWAETDRLIDSSLVKLRYLFLCGNKAEAEKMMKENMQALSA